MKEPTKQLYEKMEDYKRFAVILLSVGVFFYLGVIIPTGTKSEMEITSMMGACSVFLTGSIFFFAKVKAFKVRLL
jgi:hypothetical protein